MLEKLLERTVERFLAVPISECEQFEKSFGIIIKKPNYFMKPMPQLFTGEFEQLDTDKQYVFSELVQQLNPNSATKMMSHEGEIYEVVHVIGPAGLSFEQCSVRQPAAGMHVSPFQERYKKGETFLAVDSDSPNEINKPRGFYHQLINFNTNIISLAHILIIAEKQMAVKDGKIMKYGINRPPNSYKPTG